MIEQLWKVEKGKDKSHRHNRDFVLCRQNYRIWQGEMWLRKQYILPSFQVKSGCKCRKGKSWILKDRIVKEHLNDCQFNFLIAACF